MSSRRCPSRIHAIVLGAIAIAVVAVGVTLLVPGTQCPRQGSMTSADAARPSPLAAALDTPDAAVRAFFRAFALARETNDPSVIEPFVNGTDSAVYRSFEEFLKSQIEQGRGSTVTLNKLTNFEIDEQEDRAIVQFDHHLGGYDIDLYCREPLASPILLPTQRKRVELTRVDGAWLVDDFEIVESPPASPVP